MSAPPFEMGMLGRRRVRHVKQAEAAECGLASLLMVANHHGHELDLGALRRRFAASSRGMSLRSLMQTADALGLSARPLKVGLKGLGNVQLPAILHWDMNHFVVLERIKGDRGFVLDPANDGRWHDAESLSRHFTGVAVELRPRADFKPEREKRELKLGQLWSNATGFKRTLAQVAILSLVLQAYALGAPLFLQLALDQALPAFDADLLTVLAVGFGLFAVVNATALLLRSFVLLSAGTAVSYGVASNVARHLMRLPIGWFEKRTVGDVLSRFQSVQPIQKLLTESAATSAIDGLMAVLTLALMFAYSPTLALVAAGALAFYAGVRALTFPAERRAENERIAAAGREQGAMIETLRGITALRLAGRETMRHAVWQNKLSESLAASYDHERVRAWQGAAVILIQTLELVILVWLAVGLAIKGGFSVGMILAFLSYRLQFSNAGKVLIDRAIDLRMLRLHLDRLSDVALTAEDAGFAEPDHRPEPFRGEVELREVTYAYDTREPDILKGVSFRVEPGEHVAITGASGGGKTTLAKVLLGLIEPTAGEVRIDGLPLSRFGRRALREHVGAVLQDDLLFAGNIAENVAGFDVVDPERLDEALRAASIAEDVARMPMKHLTLVGDMGSNLSGGQRQRILLARALYRRPKLLVIDEGTAHLDVEHERSVNDAINRLGVTRIIIAHRRETVQAASRVITLADGVLAADETRRNRVNETPLAS